MDWISWFVVAVFLSVLFISIIIEKSKNAEYWECSWRFLRTLSRIRESDLKSMLTDEQRKQWDKLDKVDNRKKLKKLASYLTEGQKEKYNIGNYDVGSDSLLNVIAFNEFEKLKSFLTREQLEIYLKADWCDEKTLKD